MKTKTYRFGKTTCKAYCKTVGEGYEVGFNFGGTQVFVGNFIHSGEASKWWNLMNKNIRGFCRRFWVGTHHSTGFYSKFLSHHIYKTYYAFVNKMVFKYGRTFERACKTDIRRYNKMRKSWSPREQVRLRAA